MPVRVPQRRLTQQPHISADPPLAWHVRPGATGQSQPMAADSSRATGQGTTTASVTVTCAGNTLVAAFVTWDKTTNTAGAGVMSGGGLTWIVGVQANTESATNGGGAEIHTAYAAAGLAAQSLTATVTGALATSLTVVTFTGAAAYQHGAAAKQDNQAAALFSQPVVNQLDVSWVWAVVYNFDTGTAGTPAGGQTVVRSYTDGVGDGGWVQCTTVPTVGAGNVVTIADSAPSVHGHMAVLEIIPDFSTWVPAVISINSGVF